MHWNGVRFGRFLPNNRYQATDLSRSRRARTVKAREPTILRGVSSSTDRKPSNFLHFMASFPFSAGLAAKIAVTRMTSGVSFARSKSSAVTLRHETQIRPLPRSRELFSHR